MVRGSVPNVPRGILAACLVLAGALLAPSADARRPPTRAGKAKIVQAINRHLDNVGATPLPAMCVRARISTVNRHWGTWTFNVRNIDAPECRDLASNGVGVMHRRHGRWRQVSAGSDFHCKHGLVPHRVQRDLRIRCAPELGFES